MFYQYHEIIGSEKPIYTEKPDGFLTFGEIPSGDFPSFDEVAYLEVLEAGREYYEPLYSKRG
ncbi:hypothetical protein [Tuberibacillus sp. Marseille-P3662]|uniref:hypothetical protein n=1 Tax=Tuberibacillus sp. Marseille-P3662 TaxID=1965358 RepID=UPI000A1C806D|nr:hypothetical protein [Tuberibacillus sp. Marseille-P3662]